VFSSVICEFARSAMHLTVKTRPDANARTCKICISGILFFFISKHTFPHFFTIIFSCFLGSRLHDLPHVFFPTSLRLELGNPECKFHNTGFHRNRSTTRPNHLKTCQLLFDTRSHETTEYLPSFNFNMDRFPESDSKFKKIRSTNRFESKTATNRVPS